MVIAVRSVGAPTYAALDGTQTAYDAVVATPAGVQPGDYLVAVIRSQSTNSTSQDATSAGWSLLTATRADLDAATTNRTIQRMMNMLGLPVTPTGPAASYTFRLNNWHSSRLVINIVALTGVDIWSPLAARRAFQFPNVPVTGYSSTDSFTVPEYTAAASRFVLEHWGAEFSSPNDHALGTYDGPLVKVIDAVNPSSGSTSVSRTAHRLHAGYVGTTGNPAHRNSAVGTMSSPGVHQIALTDTPAVPAQPTESLPATKVLSPVADAAVLSTAATTNYGTNTQIWAGENLTREAFLKFAIPQTPAGSYLDSATLTLYGSSDANAPSPDTFDVTLVSGSWTETAVTWNTRPTAAVGAVLGSFVGPADTSQPRQDVSLAVSGFAQTPANEVTLRVAGRSGGTDQARWFSRDYSVASRRPVLTLVYKETNPSPATVREQFSRYANNSTPDISSSGHTLRTHSGPGIVTDGMYDAVEGTGAVYLEADAGAQPYRMRATWRFDSMGGTRTGSGSTATLVTWADGGIAKNSFGRRTSMHVAITRTSCLYYVRDVLGNNINVELVPNGNRTLDPPLPLDADCTADVVLDYPNNRATVTVSNGQTFVFESPKIVAREGERYGCIEPYYGEDGVDARVRFKSFDVWANPALVPTGLEVEWRRTGDLRTKAKISAVVGGVERVVTDLGFMPRVYSSVSNVLSRDEFMMAHRGGSADWVEMTRRAYTNAAAWGAGMLEMSVFRTSDGVWVGSHDSTTARMFPDYPSVDIRTVTWDQIKDYRTRDGNHALYKLVDFLDEFADSHICMVDNKAAAFQTEFLDLLDAHGGPTRIMNKSWSGSSGNRDLAGLAALRGYKSWGFIYASEIGNLATAKQNWDAMGLEYSASQADWDTLIAGGPSIVIAHIMPTAATVQTAKTKILQAMSNTGRTVRYGYQISGVRSAIPRRLAQSVSLLN